MELTTFFKVKIIPPTVHNTLDTGEKDMEKNKTKGTSEKVEKCASISKDESSQPSIRLSEKETPKTSSIVPDEEYQFDPEGKSAISGQKRTGWL